MDEIEIKEMAIERAYDYLERQQIGKENLADHEWREIVYEQEQMIKEDLGY